MIDLEKLKLARYPNKLSDSEKEFLMQTYFWANSLKEALHCLRENINSQPICQYDKCSEPAYFNMCGRNGYTKGCCKGHTVKATMQEKYGVENPGQLDSTKKKVKSTVRKKYGCVNVFQSEEIKERIKQTTLKKYGVEYSSHRSNFSEIVKKTNIEKYGFEAPIQNPEIKKRIRQTTLEKYGVENISMLPEIRRKAEETMMERYGKYHYSQTNDFLEKSKKTNLEKYGVEYPMQSPYIFEKNLKWAYKYKEYIWKTGEISKLQGNEPIVLKELEEKGYTSKDVLTNTKDMPEIWYEFEGKQRRYYPDFYIPTENLIIEVKSSHTLNVQLTKNQAKFQAVKDAGFNFRLEVR